MNKICDIPSTQLCARILCCINDIFPNYDCGHSPSVPQLHYVASNARTVETLIRKLFHTYDTPVGHLVCARSLHGTEVHLSCGNYVNRRLILLLYQIEGSILYYLPFIAEITIKYSFVAPIRTSQMHLESTEIYEFAVANVALVLCRFIHFADTHMVVECLSRILALVTLLTPFVKYSIHESHVE